MPSDEPIKTSERSPSTGHLYVRTSDGPGEIRFLFEQQEKRIGWATGASMVTHALLIAVIFALISYTPELTQHPMLLDRTPPQLVWIAEPGAGGGGGGGGNRQQEPPKKAELKGQDKVVAPVVEKKPDPKPEDKAPLDAPPVNIPAVTQAPSAQTSAGSLEASNPDTTSQGSGSGGGAGTGTGTGIGSGTGSGYGPGEGGGTGGGVYRPGNGVESPRLIRSVRPNYTAEAMRAKVQGVVRLEGVVNADGSVGDVKVIRSLDSVFGLDQEAIKAAKQFRFYPGTRFGQPVAVLVSFEIEFTLR